MVSHSLLMYLSHDVCTVMPRGKHFMMTTTDERARKFIESYLRFALEADNLREQQREAVPYQMTITYIYEHNPHQLTY